MNDARRAPDTVTQEVADYYRDTTAESYLTWGGESLALHLGLSDDDAPITERPALDAVRAARARHDREEPRNDVVAQMDALGYVDLLRLGRAPAPDAYRDALRTPLPDGARATCWAKTRVDYAWASPGAMTLRSLARADIVETDASDHHAVVVELAPR